jgi:hypothetical protein
MRQYLLVSLLVLIVHGASIFLISPYRTLLMAVGGVFVHATDIADLPDLLFGGAALVGGILLFLSLAMVHGVRRTGRRRTSA